VGYCRLQMSCSGCAVGFEEADVPSTQCDRCFKFYCMDCAGIDATLLDELIERKESWYCPGKCRKATGAIRASQANNRGEYTKRTAGIKRQCRTSPNKNTDGNDSENDNLEHQDKGVSEELSQLRIGIESIKKQLEPLRGLNDLRLALVEATEKIELLVEENRELKTKISEKNVKIIALESKVNSLEQYGRRDCLEIHGIEETARENCLALIQGLAKASGLTLHPSDISTAHRIPNQKGERKKIIVKLVRRDCRNALFDSIKSSRPTVTNLNVELSRMGIPPLRVEQDREGIFANESLTKHNRGILIKALANKTKLNIISIWTSNGQTKYKCSKEDPAKSFGSEEEIEEMIRSLDTRV
jgi:hypothetical protein